MCVLQKITLLALMLVLQSASLQAKILVHWTHSVFPPPKTLGVKDIVISYDSNVGPVVGKARKQGLNVFLLSKLGDAQAAASLAMKEHASGIILQITISEEEQSEAILQKLRSSFPELAIRSLNPHGKQPQMKGQMVVERDGILQVSSPTSQPWVDSNLALVRFEQSFHPVDIPLYSFEWDLSDSLKQQQGPAPEDYCLAVAEASAFHADLILNIHEPLQEKLAAGDSSALDLWSPVKRYLEFSEKQQSRNLQPLAYVGVVTDTFATSYEAINLMARHNIPFRVLHSADLKDKLIRDLDMLVVFSIPQKEQAQAITDFASQGGIVVLVNARGSYPWQSNVSKQVAEHSLSYSVGSGRIIEFSEPVTDPETFSRDIRRLMGDRKALISLWNSLTSVVAPYRDTRTGEIILEVLNYAQESLQIQIQIKGNMRDIQFETPERGCCQRPAAVPKNGFTEFVVPWLMIGARGTLTPANGEALKN